MVVDAVSGTRPPVLPRFNVAPATPLTQRLLPPPSNRAGGLFDSERVILERMASVLPRNSSGIVRIFTERAQCSSCREAARQFERLFDGKVRVQFTQGGF